MKAIEGLVIRKNLVHAARDNTDQSRSVSIQQPIHIIKAYLPSTSSTLNTHTTVSQTYTRLVIKLVFRTLTEHINQFVRSVSAAWKCNMVGYRKMIVVYHFQYSAIKLENVKLCKKPTE